MANDFSSLWRNIAVLFSVSIEHDQTFVMTGCSHKMQKSAIFQMAFFRLMLNTVERLLLTNQLLAAQCKLRAAQNISKPHFGLPCERAFAELMHSQFAAFHIHDSL